MTTSFVSPVKHSITLENPYFHYNTFLGQFLDRKNMNKESKNKMKRVVVNATPKNQPTSNRVFPTYKPNKYRKEYMVVISKKIKIYQRVI